MAVDSPEAGSEAVSDGVRLAGSAVDGIALSEEEHRAVATEMYTRWQSGAPKSALEIEYWGAAASHGKRFTSYIRRWLGHETERKSAQTLRIEHLEVLLRVHGISPTDVDELKEEFRLVAKSRESALAALRVYNDPIGGYRSETFIVLMVIAWNSLFQAIMEQDGDDYYEYDENGQRIVIGGQEKVKGTRELMLCALPDRSKVQANLDFFLKLRHVISHRYLPALDPHIVSEAQAMLLNYENILVEHFGQEAGLAEQLSVPLQLSGFREATTMASLKKAQARLPVDVQDFLSRHREEVPDDVLRSPEYALRIFFVPVTANRERSADTVAHFVKPGTTPPEVEEALQGLAVVTKPKQIPVASGDLYRPSEVVDLVSKRLPFRFEMDTHTRSWKHYEVRPSGGSDQPELTNQQYCRWDRLSRGHGYTQAWVDKLVDDLSDPATYEEVVGYPPPSQIEPATAEEEAG